ncbi:hypothetical protein EH243_08305 [Amphritea opalescens]|uniref:TniQ domain-containing protein n=1 Tax=Amphritea opalescens TaxID=2490544 RepID=A0A430KRJ9_9GAMM|nr:TniQ family protein [Amphritea opalescens]RTE66112.1 hypothetical protein EH243_08305 [Amphritea opalescens]
MNNLKELLPGEHLAGFIGRLHLLGVYEYFPATVDSLGLSNCKVRPHRYFHQDDVILQHVFQERGIESACFQHGLGNYVRPFLKNSEQQEVARYLAQSDVKALSFKLHGHYGTNTNHWRWCCECVEEDQNEYGISYYHRDHQLPGTFHCDKHQLGLSGKCSECGFLADSIDQLLVPPVNNACPHCGAWVSGFDGYFSDAMKDIEAMTFRLANEQHELNVDQFVTVLQRYIGIDEADIGTYRRKILIRAWEQELADNIDPQAFRMFFSKFDVAATGKMPTLFKNAHLHNLSTIKRPCHPLIYLSILNYVGFDSNDLSILMG